MKYNSYEDMPMFLSIKDVSETVGLSVSRIYDIANTDKTFPCVILGRNANNVLREQKNVINIFIYSNDLDFKVKRKMKLENISYDEALNRLKQVDKKRRKYYESINNRQKWGDRTEYDYLIDSGVLGVDKTVDLIVDIYNKASL